MKGERLTFKERRWRMLDLLRHNDVTCDRSWVTGQLRKELRRVGFLVEDLPDGKVKVSMPRKERELPQSEAEATAGRVEPAIVGLARQADELLKGRGEEE